MLVLKRWLFFCTFWSVVAYAEAQVRLAGFYTDSMVLQRGRPLVFSGTGKSGEKLQLHFASQAAKARVDKSGRWKVTLPAMPAGGPYQLSIKASNSILVKDIWLGDVWFCSGQSNMEWKLGWLEKEKANPGQFNNAAIRVATVPHRMAATKLNEAKGLVWKTLTPENSREFSAVASYFGLFLQPEIDVPVGLIVSAWGGTDIEPWISAETLSQLEKHRPALQRLQRTGDMEAMAVATAAAQAAWNDSLQTKDPGQLNGWHLPAFNDAAWRQMELPGVWDTVGVEGQGNGWFRQLLHLTSTEAKSTVLLSLGKPNQQAQVFMNGQALPPSLPVKGLVLYSAPPSLLVEGANLLTIKLTKLYGRGGLTGKSADFFALTTSGTKSLASTWKFSPGYLSRNPSVSNSPNLIPASLYNAMVHPFTQLPIKGVLWYQGENNTSRPQDYSWHLQAMIKDWRQHWKDDSLPFLLVQLPNFLHENPVNRNFVQIRQAQQEATALPRVGLVVTYDIGDSTDIHPVNKKDVGHRLALLARKMTYGEKLVAEGPTVKDFTVKEGDVHLFFQHTGNGLFVADNYGYLRGFDLAGSDGIFYPAQARVEGETVIVTHSRVSKPIAIRYAWAENPDANLYNSEGLPAAPFFIHLRNSSLVPAGQ